MLEEEIPIEKVRANKIVEMFKRENEEAVIDEPAYQADQLSFLFDKLYDFSKYIMQNLATDESIDECVSILNGLKELVEHFSKTDPEQFAFLFQFIWILNNRNELKQLKDQTMYILNKLIGIYPDLIDDLLLRDEIKNFIDIFSGIFLNFDANLLLSIIDKSENALNVLIDNNLLDTIFKGVISTVLQIFPNFNTEEKITDKIIGNDFYETKSLLFNYWIYALKILEKISIKYTKNNSVQLHIFNFCKKFLSEEFYNISRGFFFRVIDCISSCIIHFETLEIFDIDYYLAFFIKTLNGDYLEARESIFNLFNIITQPPFLYQWDPDTILSISTNAITWYNSKDYYNYINYFSIFIDFISNVIFNQNEIFEILNSASIFDEIFNIFIEESFKLKFHIINLFLNFAYKEIWPKSVTFYADHQIISELLMFVTSVQIDQEFVKKVINCLFQISDENFLNPYPPQKVAIVGELKSPLVEETFNCFENENSEIAEMASNLMNRISDL